MGSRSWAAALLLLASVGCSKNYTNICNKACEKTVACDGTSADLATCKAYMSCENLNSNPGNCTDDSLKAQYDCLDGCLAKAECPEWRKCVGDCPGCIKFK